MLIFGIKPYLTCEFLNPFGIVRLETGVLFEEIRIGTALEWRRKVDREITPLHLVRLSGGIERIGDYLLGQSIIVR